MTLLLILLVPTFGLLALGFTFWKSAWVSRQDPGTEKMERISRNISEGAMAFLKAEYKVLAVFVGCAAILLLAINEGVERLVALSFVVGAICSALAGFIGMKVATKANVRTTNAARTSLGDALEVAFGGGSVMGLGVVGLGLLGLGVLLAVYSATIGMEGARLASVLTIITGFSFGASSIALFARVGGGIYTKAADVGADLVGKVEAGIPEDHPLNPATIADNVGDNVGDVAGMGADLFESYVGSIVAAMVLGGVFVELPEFGDAFSGLGAVLLPLMLAGCGVFASIAGTFMVRVRGRMSPHRALNAGEISAGAVLVALASVTVKWMLPTQWVVDGVEYTSTGVLAAVVLGLVAGVLIGYTAAYYTGTERKPVRGIVLQSATGPATNVIAGLGVGMLSTALPIAILATTILLAHHFAGLYGIAIAAVGMLSNLGIQLAMDAYGPISDNAGGIAEMSDLPSDVRRRTDELDAVGNTTAAVGKGFAIGSAALTALALFAAFKTAYDSTHEGILVIEVTDPKVISMLFVGAMMAFLFSSLAMGAVGRAAGAIIEEVRRQFTEIPELRAALVLMRKNAGKERAEWSEEDRRILSAADGKAEYGKCVEISTQSALRQMIKPGLLAVLAPVVVGFAGGGEMLGGLLVGVTVCGVLMALFQSNAGGAWDNAKKIIERGCEVNGQKLIKGSDAHKAAVVGDTVGDPFKDTSGPSMNILLKVMSVVALVIAAHI
jgi:K(+)-stimulated pyrophosphate-energized sodium pump